MIVDRKFWPLLESIRTNLCAAVAEFDPDLVLCACSIAPGASVDLSGVQGGKGMAWVRLVNVFPSDSPPATNTQMTACAPSLAATIEIGIARCIPVLPRTAATQPVAVSELSASQQTTDMAAMVKALCATRRRHVLTQYAPGGPEGGAVWGVWTAVFPQED